MVRSRHIVKHLQRVRKVLFVAAPVHRFHPFQLLQFGQDVVQQAGLVQGQEGL